MAPTPDALAGLTIVDGPVSLTSSRMGVAHSLVWSTSELHTDDVMMAASAFGRRLATGPWIAALLSGLFFGGNGGRAVREHGLRAGALRSITVRYSLPVRAGDTLLLRSQIMTCEPDADGWALTIRGECLLDGTERALEMQCDYAAASLTNDLR